MEQEEWDNDPEYPRAPLPPHERSWRHPSEIGSSEWVHSEPPLVVGRGLSIATGTVGALLALGLLWLMIPHSDRGGVAVETSSPTVRPETTSRALLGSTSPPPTTAAPTTAEHVAQTSSSALEAAPTTTLRITTTVPAIEAESTTIVEGVPAMAVALMPGHLVVTTAAAASGRSELDVRLPNGDTVHGSVVAINESSGTAVLSVPVEITAAQIAPSAEVAPSEGVVKGNTASIWTDEDGTKVSDDDVTPTEGDLVLDHDGALIGMCTKGSNGTRLVSVDALLEAVNGASADEAPLWMGVRAEINEAGEITLATVMEDGPAAAAGLRVGDVVKAIDGTPIADLAALKQAILAHKAGDTVTVSVVHSDATDAVDVPVTLVERPI